MCVKILGLYAHVACFLCGWSNICAVIYVKYAYSSCCLVDSSDFTCGTCMNMCLLYIPIKYLVYLLNLVGISVFDIYLAMPWNRCCMQCVVSNRERDILALSLYSNVIGWFSYEKKFIWHLRSCRPVECQVTHQTVSQVMLTCYCQVKYQCMKSKIKMHEIQNACDLNEKASDSNENNALILCLCI